MAGPLVAATTKLTQGQWRVLLRRILKEEGGQLTPRAAEQILQREPPVERSLGTLFNKAQLEEGLAKRPMHMPIEQAREMYSAAPEKYSLGRYSGFSPVDELKAVPPGSPEDLALGISYVRNKFEPVVPSGLQGGISAINRGERESLIDQALAGRGLSREDLRGTPQKFLQSEGVTLPEPSIKDVLHRAEIADQLWRDMGGGNSLGGREWGKLLSLQSTGVKNTFHSAKDWFMSCFNQYEKNPINFAKKHPREAGIIKRIKDEVGE
jgi:hypothetical protein